MSLLQENKLENALYEYNRTKDEELKARITKFIQDTEINDLREIMFDALVSPLGKSDTIAGEMIRAVNKIGHTYYKDGDIYFSGYGLETLGSSAVYLSKISNALETLIVRLFPEQYLITSNKKESYSNFVIILETRVLQVIQQNPDLILKYNIIDSATEYDDEAIELFGGYEEVLNSGEIEDLDDYVFDSEEEF